MCKACEAWRNLLDSGAENDRLHLEDEQRADCGAFGIVEHDEMNPFCSCPACLQGYIEHGILSEGEIMSMANQPLHFVRINKPDHPMHGMVGTTDFANQDSLFRVRILDSSFSGHFTREELQPIEAGTKVLIEVEVMRFFQQSMMVAGGWMPLSRIIDIVE